MPVNPTYPGVYIEEVPSGVRTIVGVATSITAFIGTSERGPVSEPTLIHNFGDFERRFGGLTATSMMSYAVRDFYTNGGSQALIVRIANNANTSRISVPLTGGGNLTLLAATPGGWGNRLQVSIDYGENDELATTFNLRVYETNPDGTDRTEERFLNLSMDDDAARYIVRVLEQESQLIRVDTSGAVPTARPASTVGPSSPPTSPPSTTLHRISATANSGSDGSTPTATHYEGSRDQKTGLYALEKADLFNLLCIPPPARDGNTPDTVYQKAMAYCVERRAMLLVDPPREWGASPETAAASAKQGLSGLGLTGTAARNAAIYFPRLRIADPLRENQIETFVPSGMVAGVMARTDTRRGVWKSPAGLDAAINGAQGLQVNLTDDENGVLNPIGINCLRTFPIHGRVVWGSRTLRGADQAADEYKYTPVRRLALFIEETLYRGTQWVVFEPNDEPLWAQIRLNVGAFMHNLFRQGAFQGQTPREAYLVKCDPETTTQYDIDRGVVNIVVGFSPLKPAEFVIIKIQQLAGQSQA